MKTKSTHALVSRRHVRLLEQRRSWARREHEDAARTDVEHQWIVKTQRVDRTRVWWSCDADGDATPQDITCWSKSSRPYTTTSMEVTITRAGDGCPSLTTTAPSMPARSWKTLMVGMACNR
ncbi:hypothetical protein PHMEG_00027692 [Phytophthora megakarya]|uniref:Uncharacterized protein n=1 Tax=Phytophthora megakarya TaxID=4795 RepID=A0A225V990_9STRA|nr:hypothetical protein PHMEG_00027692 [Phytophthora megakarya]